MATTGLNRRRRGFRILTLFFGLVLSFTLQYLRARLTGRSYNFFEDSDRNRKRAIRIRETALQMGGVLIKVGQFLSSRVDLLPSEYIEELALLQDEVPGVPVEEIIEVIVQELRAPLADLFRSFDPVPVAAASLGQVHRAELPTGQQVAVKVQRPGIAAIVEADLASLRYIVRWLSRYTPLGKRVNLPDVLVEFEHTLRLELDYGREGHHAERLAVMFAGDHQIVVPRVYWSHSAGRVITLQFMTGVKVTDFARLEDMGISRSETAEILMRAYLQQVLRNGFFHADPHPGNIFVRPGPQVVLLDFGMVGEILPKTRDNIRVVFLGIMRRDYDQVILALQRLGFFTRNADIRAIRRALAWTVENFINLSFGELQSVDPRLVIDQLQDVLFAESFQIPANYAFLGRALGTLSGLCTALDPSFQFVSVAEPYARDLLAQERGWRGTLSLAQREGRAIATAVYRLPFLTQDTLQRVEVWEAEFEDDLNNAVQSLNRVDRSIRSVVNGLMVVGFLIVAALVFTTHNEAAAIAALVISVFFILRIFAPLPRRRGGRR